MLWHASSRWNRQLVIAAGLAMAIGCNGSKLVDVPGPTQRTEVFPQESASKIDLLWVIDDSAWMIPFQASLGTSFERFIDVFAEGSIDYRIAVTTEDMVTKSTGTNGTQGTLFGKPQIISSTDPDPVSEFQANVAIGDTGDDYHQGMTAAQTVLQNFTTTNAPILEARTSCEAACNGASSCISGCDAVNEPLFLRPDAYLAIIFVAIHADSSEGDPVYYSHWFQTLKGLGNSAEVQVSAICGDVPNPTCPNTVEGTMYMQVAQLTNGVIGSICDPTFDQDLTNLANNTVSLKRHFLLGGTPKVSSLVVAVDYRCDTPHDDPSLASCASINDTCSSTSTPEQLGIICTPAEAVNVGVDAGTPDGYTAGWSYQCSDNSLYFHADATADSVPGQLSQVEVTYLPAAAGSSGCNQ